MNPIWRGIGCILFFLTPIIAFAVANVFLATGTIQRYMFIPPELTRRFVIPVLNVTVSNFYASLALGAAVTILLFAVFFVVYGILYSVIGPSRYGPLDAPPVRSRRTRKSR